MNFLIHLIYTLLLADFLHLSSFELKLAIVFGVLIDLDHVYYYIKNFIKTKKIIQMGMKQRTFIQEPIFYPVIGLISLYFNTLVPLIFFSLHLALDYIMDYEKKPFWPISDYSVKGGLKSYGKMYFLFTVSSLILYLLIKFI